MADPSPAPDWITTSCPFSTSSRTPEGVSATRYSSVLISVGTPTFTREPRFWWSCQELPAAQREPEVDPVAGGVQRAPGQLLDPADAVAERVAVAEELARGALPLPVAFDERLQRAHQLAAVRALAVLDRGEDRVAEQPQRLVVLQREQQLEGAEVAVGGEQVAGAIAVRVPRQLVSLERAARLVERAPQVARRYRAPRPGGERQPRLARHPAAHPLGQREQVVVAGAAPER